VGTHGDCGVRVESRSQKPEARSQKPEARSQKSECRKTCPAVTVSNSMYIASPECCSPRRCGRQTAWRRRESQVPPGGPMRSVMVDCVCGGGTVRHARRRWRSRRRRPRRRGRRSPRRLRVPDQGATGRLPIKRVVLYKNGVGFFEHLGRVRGSEQISIDFTSGQLNDVLKSLTAVRSRQRQGDRRQFQHGRPRQPQAGRIVAAARRRHPTLAFLGAIRGRASRCREARASSPPHAVGRRTNERRRPEPDDGA